MSIECPTFDKVLLVYKRAIKLYLDAQQNVAEGYAGDDYKAALEEAERPKLVYRDASDNFMEHLAAGPHVSRMAASPSSNR